MRLSNWRGILWFIWCPCTAGVVGQCTREELDRVGEEVAICVIRQQDMVMEVEKIFRRDIYIEEAMCLMLENIKDKCVQMWSQCYQDRQVGFLHFYDDDDCVTYPGIPATGPAPGQYSACMGETAG